MINCIAIDDEPIALAIIAEHCRKLGGISLETFTSPVEGMKRVAETKPDIVFLDIEMNSHNGVALARELPEGTCVIFTTAYARYALDGFEVDAVDFLQKPIFFERFERAVGKARRRLREKDPEPVQETITLRVEHRNVVVDIADITHIEAMDNYVKVFRNGLPMVLSQITMKEMEEMLPAGRFVRVHRSFIVAVKAIDSFSNRRISVRGCDTPIPVGRKYTETFNSLRESFNSLG